MSAEWDKSKAAALKILGSKGKVPDMPGPVEKAAEGMGKANDELDKVREDMEAKVLALQNANDAVKNGLKQFLAKMEKDDLGLDSKSKDDLKRIQQARKLLTDRLQAGVKHYETDDKMLDELDKHIIQLGKYKPKPAPI